MDSDKRRIEEQAPLRDGKRPTDHVTTDQTSSYSPYRSPVTSYDENYYNDGQSELSSVEFGSLHIGLKRLVLVAAATAATLGYDVGIMAAAIQPIQAQMQLSGVQKELAMGSLNFVAAAGALLGGTVAHRSGRKPTVTLCSWIFVVGTLMMALAPIYSILLLGRIVTGVGVGVSFVVAPVYLAEVAPTNMRGQLNTVFDVAINGGILLGYVVGFLVHLCPLVAEIYQWRVMLGLGMVLPILVLWNLAHLPESPRWLVMKQRSEEAAHVLSAIGSDPRQILRTVSSIEDELVQERSTNLSRSASSHVSSSNLLCGHGWSNGMKLAVAVGFWQQITGTEAVLYYSADFLEHAGLDSPTRRLLGNIFVGLCKLLPELVAMNKVDQVGRRPLMLLSSVSLVISTALLSLSFSLGLPPLLIVFLLCAVMASFSMGLGPFSFLVASENLGLSERATGVTLCAAANRLTSGTVALTAVSLYETVGYSGLFAIYAVFGLLSLPFYYRSVPETTGQSLEELAAARHRESQEPPPHPAVDLPDDSEYV